jgi:hypothetical protein
MNVLTSIASFSALNGFPKQSAVLVAMLGDSQAGANGMQALSQNKLAGSHSRAVIAYNTGLYRVRDLQHGIGVGWHSMAPALADRLHELTGLGTLWVTDFPTAGCGTFRHISPSVNLDFRETPSAANGNRLFLTDGSIQLDTVIPRTLQYVQNAMPTFSIARKVLIHFDGGTEMASGFEAGTITQQDVIDFYQAMLGYFETNWGFEKLVLIPPQGYAEGDTRRWDLARAAVRAACDGARIINGCDFMDEGPPLVVDAAGGHISGTDKYDGAHYDGATNDAIGKTAAQVLATALGY